MKRDLEISQSQKEEAVIARQEIEVILRNTKKEMEVQELVRLTVYVYCTHVHMYMYININS